MRETFSEWDCMPGSAPGWIESMDAAGVAVDIDTPRAPAAAEATAATEARPCLDLRHLPAPEPLERALSAADALGPGDRLEVWTPMLPVPLLQALQARGYCAHAESQPDGTAKIVIVRGHD